MNRIVAGFVALLTLSYAVPALADAPYTVVVDGLAAPRGLAFGPGDRLYVAQAATGAITEIRAPWSTRPATRDIVTGLPSIVDEGQRVGVDGLSALGNGTLYAIMAGSNEGTGTGSLLGHLLQVNPGGHVRDVAAVGDFDYAWSGEHQTLAPNDFPDANPYGVLALPGRVYVVDAGANTLNLVRPDGSIEILAYFPNNTFADATPTCVAQGPDGALYVGTLALADSMATRSPKAIVYRVDPGAVNPGSLDTILHVATPWATDLWPINGCTFGPDGSFYASLLFTNPDFADPRSDVVKIAFTDPGTREFLTGGALQFPAGVAVGRGGLYVANGSAFVPAGQVVRLSP